MPIGRLQETDVPRRKPIRAMFNALVVGVVVAYIILIVVGKVDSAARLGWQEFVLIMFVFLFVEGFFSRIAELSLSKDGITFQLNSIQATQEAQKSDLAAVRTALTGLVTKYEFLHLTHLNSPGPYFCKFGYIFFDEVRRLDSIQFIRPTKPGGFNVIKSDTESNPSEFDLKQYVEITDEGKNYLKARQNVGQ